MDYIVGEHAFHSFGIFHFEGLFQESFTHFETIFEAVVDNFGILSTQVEDGQVDSGVRVTGRMSLFVLLEGLLRSRQLAIVSLLEHEPNIVKTGSFASLCRFLIAEHSTVFIIFTIVKVSTLLQSLWVVASLLIVPMRSFDVSINAITVLVHLSQVEVAVGQDVGVRF